MSPTNHHRQILMMKPLPNVSTNYSLPIHEEQQRDIYLPSSIAIDSIAMQVSFDLSTLSKKFTCNHWEKLGHIKAQCYRLNGFPANFNFTKSKKEESKSSVKNVINTTSNDFTRLVHSVASTSSKQLYCIHIFTILSWSLCDWWWYAKWRYSF